MNVDPKTAQARTDDSKVGLKSVSREFENLSGQDLHGQTFEGETLDRANFSRSNLRGTIFQDASLKGANFSNADVSCAQFAGADLTDANFHGAIGLNTLPLTDVDFSRARGIAAAAFARRDTTGCQLPRGLLPSLSPVRDASLNARTVFQIMLLACAYCHLSLLTVTDQQVIMDKGRFVLPILNIEISQQWFFLLGPIFLILTFIYLHVYLRHLWEGAARLPARFPDGTPVGELTSPWLMTALIDRYSERRRSEVNALHHENRRAVIVWVQGGLALLAGFWAVPLTILWFGARYLTRQSVFDTAVHAAMLWASVTIARIFYISMRDTLSCAPSGSGEAPPDSAPMKPWAARKAAVYAALIVFPVSGVLAKTDPGRALLAPDLPSAAPSAAKRAVVESDEQTWESENLYFYDRSLVGARGGRAYLKNANLECANLAQAELQRAKLNGANLQHALLRRANLQDADLSQARVAGADLSQANLKRATGLTQAMLEQACGTGTKLPTGLAVRPCAAAARVSCSK